MTLVLQKQARISSNRLLDLVNVCGAPKTDNFMRRFTILMGTGSVVLAVKELLIQADQLLGNSLCSAFFFFFDFRLQTTPRST